MFSVMAVMRVTHSVVSDESDCSVPSDESDCSVPSDESDCSVPSDWFT